MAKRNPAVPDSGTITVHVPIVFRRHGGRKTLAAPNGPPTAFAAGRPRIDNALVKAVARAFCWRKLIETGAYANVQEIAIAEKMNASYVGRVLRLTLVAPILIEAILDGRQPYEITLKGLMRPFSVEWDLQQASVSPSAITN